MSDSAIAVAARRLRFSRDNAPSVVVWVVVVAVGLIFFYWLRDQPFYYDADGYMVQSRAISDHGLLSKGPYSDIRTYGYPFFLTGALRLARLLHHGPHAGVFIAQWPLFAGSAWLATRSLFRSRRTQLIAFAAVAANPLLVVYSAEAFTESATLSCVLFGVAALGYASRSRLRRAAAWLVAGAAVTSYAVAIRPGSLLIPACFTLAAVAILLRRRGQAGGAAVGATALAIVVALLLPLAPQVAINHRHYDSWSPLPVFDIADLQAQGGMTIVRYIGNVAPCGLPAIAFPAPARPVVPASTTPIDAIRYYVTDWPGGPETVVLHVFTGLDPHPFLIDQHDFGARYEYLLQAFTLALLFLAARGLPRALRRMRDADGRIRPDTAFLAAVFVVFTGQLATSQAEYRFGSVPLITISLLAAVGASYGGRPSRHSLLLAGGAYLGALLLWVTVSDLILSTAPGWVQCS